MKFIITGSGGSTGTPRQLCRCRASSQLRSQTSNPAGEKESPYARCCCSLYVEDINTLIDIPEDIIHALNNCNIRNIDYLFYSHMDPDHTIGMRKVEKLKLDWLGMSKNIKFSNHIKTIALPDMIGDVDEIRSKRRSVIDYYEALKLISRRIIKQSIKVKEVKVTFVPANPSGDVTIFVFENNDKKLIYAPCDVKLFPKDELFEKADYLIIGSTIIGMAGNPLNNELFFMDEIAAVKNNYHIKNVVIADFEEDCGKTSKIYEHYADMEKQYRNIKFAYDGMVINV